MSRDILDVDQSPVACRLSPVVLSGVKGEFAHEHAVGVDDGGTFEPATSKITRFPLCSLPTPMKAAFCDSAASLS